MNRRLLLYICLFVGSISPFSEVFGQSAELSSRLQLLFEQAEKGNAGQQALRAAVEEARAQVAVARSGRLPELSAEASLSYLGDARLWNRSFTSTELAPTPHFGNHLTLRVQQPLYTGGAVSSGIRLAGQAETAARQREEWGKNGLRHAVAELFLGLQRLKNLETVYRRNAAQAQSMMSQMEHRREAGTALRNDVTRHSLLFEEMSLGVTRMVAQQSVLQQKLSTALGLQDTTLWQNIEADTSEVKTEAEAYWLELARAHRADYLLTQTGRDMAQTQERIVKAGLRPSVALIAEDHLDGPITYEIPPINRNLNYWFIGVGVTYNFSSLYKQKRQLRRAQRTTEKAEKEIEAARRQLTDEVHEAWVNFNTLRSELVTRRKNVQLATENYEVISNRYAQGLAVITDLTDAANTKLEAELQWTNTHIDLLLAHYALKYVAGVL